MFNLTFTLYFDAVSLAFLYNFYFNTITACLMVDIKHKQKVCLFMVHI